jgi:uncharacterized protein
MDLWEALALLGAGTVAGAINAVVGSGTLVTFPTLLAFGYPPVLANVSNNIGLVPGSISGAWAYRRELAGQRSRVLRLAGASATGGVIGAIALLELPESAFDAIVPVLILLAVALVILQPRLSKLVAKREGAPAHGSVAVIAAVFCCGIYGGYFGAAQGVLLMGIMGVGISETMQRLNALKNVLAAIVNAVAGLLFAFVADVDWKIVALIGVGSVIGGQLGATVGRRLPGPVLRWTIVVVGVVALTVFLLG